MQSVALQTQPRTNFFLSFNFTPPAHFILETVESVASEHDVDIVTALPGTAAANPAEHVRSILEGCEGLLAVIDTESSWAANEIGMAFALRVPIFVVVREGGSVEGIAKLVTSIQSADLGNPMSVRQAVADGIVTLKAEIAKQRTTLAEPGLGGRGTEILRWDRYFELIKEAAKRISLDADESQGGLKPTLILGISRGGIIVADVLSRLLQDLPLGLLEADRKRQFASVSFSREPLAALLQLHLGSLRGSNGSTKQARVLIVDDVTKSGRSLQAASRVVRSVLSDVARGLKPKPLVRTLVLVTRGAEPRFRPDYCMLSVDPGTNVMLPYGLG